MATNIIPTQKHPTTPAGPCGSNTTGWLGCCRHLSKDYEKLSEMVATWIRLALIHLTGRRLA